jgi:hypothetical protein
MHLSIAKYPTSPGCDRRTVAKQLRDLHYTAGERGTFTKFARAKIKAVSI